MSTDGIDPKFLIAVSQFIPKALEVAKKVWSNFDQSIDYLIKQAHINYACSVIRKYSRSKTFFIRTEAVNLYDFYVPASIDCREAGRIEKIDVEKLLKISKHVIITGSGGSGKTILMRHLLLDALLHGKSFPVLVELRNLNDDNGRTIEDEILETLTANEFNLDKKYVNSSLAEGLFVLLLDGFDEVQFARRKALEKEIKKLSLVTGCQIIITSRADVSLQSWERFTNVAISSLTMEEACSLVEMINFDADIKSRFIKSLKGGVFNSHSFFLSNPLMLSIMLLTYGDSADIPKRQSSFYRQAYEALFQQHDALKSGFKRDRKTDLDIYEFSRLFSGFSMISYDARAFRFSYTDAVMYAKRASEVTGVTKVAHDGFIEDAKQAVCLLMEEGLELAFAHRSFQEYFAARFISESEELLQKKIIEKITNKKSSAVGRDNVMGLLHEMSPLTVERFYLIPELSSFFGASSNRKISKKFWFDNFCKNFDSLRYDVNEKRIILLLDEKRTPAHELMIFVSQRYFDQEYKQGVVASWQKESERFANKYFGGGSFHMKTSTLKINSEMTADILNIFTMWSLDGLEKIRLCLKDMRSRSSARSNALDRVFLL